MTKTLIQKIKERSDTLNYDSRSLKPQYQKTTKEHIDVALAILKGDIKTCTALTEIFGPGRGSAHYSSVLKWLKLAYREGRITIKS